MGSGYNIKSRKYYLEYGEITVKPWYWEKSWETEKNPGLWGKKQAQDWALGKIMSNGKKSLNNKEYGTKH